MGSNANNDRLKQLIEVCFRHKDDRESCWGWSLAFGMMTLVMSVVSFWLENLKWSSLFCLFMQFLFIGLGHLQDRRLNEAARETTDLAESMGLTMDQLIERTIRIRKAQKNRK